GSVNFVSGHSIETLDKSVSPLDSAELVITAPPPFGAALAHRTGCRITLGVLTQLIAEAKTRVVIAAPYLQPGYGLSGGPMAAALDAAAHRGVHFDIVSTGRSL